MKSSEKPSISVCIPARNESGILTDTLKKLLDLEYPKIEILVYDDCSQDNTSQIVKDFAHKGVRFIEGKELPEDWLGQPFAIMHLAHQASGKYLIIADSDKPINDELLNQLVDRVGQDYTKSVLSLEDMRSYHNYITKSFFEPALPNDEMLAKTTAWIVERSALNAFMHSDEIETYKNHLAFMFKAHSKIGYKNDLIFDHTKDNTQTFKISKNRHYYLRKLFPMLKNSISLSLLAGFLLCLILPILLIAGFVYDYKVAGLLWASLFYVDAVWLNYFSVIPRGEVKLDKYSLITSLATILVAPLKLFYAGFLILESAFRYKTDKISWRSRNICNTN